MHFFPPQSKIRKVCQGWIAHNAGLWCRCQLLTRLHFPSSSLPIPWEQHEKMPQCLRSCHSRVRPGRRLWLLFWAESALVNVPLSKSISGFKMFPLSFSHSLFFRLYVILSKTHLFLKECDNEYIICCYWNDLGSLLKLFSEISN